MITKEQFVEAVRTINKLEEKFRKDKRPYEDIVLQYYAEQDEVRKNYIRLKQEETTRHTTWGFDNTRLDVIR